MAGAALPWWQVAILCGVCVVGGWYVGDSRRQAEIASIELAAERKLDRRREAARDESEEAAARCAEVTERARREGVNTGRGQVLERVFAICPTDDSRPVARCSEVLDAFTFGRNGWPPPE